jgi:hypothetical protein
MKNLRLRIYFIVRIFGVFDLVCYKSIYLKIKELWVSGLHPLQRFLSAQKEQKPPKRFKSIMEAFRGNLSTIIPSLGFGTFTFYKLGKICFEDNFFTF